MATSSNFETLLNEARELITPNPINLKNRPKPSADVLEKNKKGFKKLCDAAAMNGSWMAHYNVAEFYYGGLDGATNIDETKAVYHYYQAWKIYGNNTIIQEKKSNPYVEPLLLNFASLVHAIQTKKDQNNNNNNNNYVIDINEAIKLCKALQKKSCFVSYKILGHCIYGRILTKLQKKDSDALNHYKKCLKLSKNNPTALSMIINNLLEGIQKEIPTLNVNNDGIIDNDDGSKKCGYCSKTGMDLLRCSRCKIVYYCNVDCQRPHWKKHKKKCKKPVQ